MFLNILHINKSTTIYARYEKIKKCLSSVDSNIYEDFVMCETEFACACNLILDFFKHLLYTKQ